MPTIEDHLFRLRERLANQTLSILVGAGFSKNVNGKLFPSWWQLLEILIKSTKTKRYLEEYRRLTNSTATVDDPSFIRYMDEEISNYIQSTGFLNVVSEYIRIQGIRESIDCFIEEHTPIAVSTQQGDSLRYYNQDKWAYIPIAPENLELHRRLIKLPWNNIYTTNYDNLLEYCIDQEVPNKINYQIENIDQELDKSAQERLPIQHQIDEITVEIATEQLAITGIGNIGSSNKQKEINDKFIALANLEAQLDAQKNRVAELSNTRAELTRSLNDCYTVVAHSSQLSLKRNRNIIKLHGDAGSNDYDFSFDNDFHKKYVISSEDYASYPIKHEAFTQLMRISLLQGHFLLIGFSGDDPNFLAWTSWVRDVVKKRNTNDIYGKICIVDVSDDGQLSRHKAQFYENHQIIHLPLKSPKAIEFLSKHHGSQLPPNDTGKILSAFFDFLGEIAPINSSQIAVEKLYREEYESYFRNLPILFDKNTQVDLSHLIDNLSSVKTNKRYNRVTPIQSYYTSRKTNFIDSFEQLIEQSPESIYSITDVTVACLIDLHIPYKSIVTLESKLGQNIETYLSDFSNCSAQLQWLKVFDSLWSENYEAVSDLVNNSKNLSTDIQCHFLGLSCLFNLRFSELQGILDGWKPTDFYPSVKAGLQSYLDAKASKNILKSRSYKLAQEELFGIELELLLAGHDRRKHLFKMYELLSHAGLAQLGKTVDKLLDDILPRSKKVEVRGSNKFASSQGLHFSNISDELSALQVFGVLMETGIPLRINNSILRSHARVFPAILNSIKHYPLPILFYSLQYDDSQFLKRVGQEFAYEPNVDQYHQQIIDNFEHAVFSNETPYNFRTSILLFLSELVISVRIDIWENLFNRIWKHAVINPIYFTEIRSPWMELFIKGLPLLKNKDLIAEIISDCIKASSSIGSESMIKCLYYIRLNPATKMYVTEIREMIDDKIVLNIISKIPSVQANLFLIGNIQELLTTSQNKELQDILGKIGFESADPQLIEIACFLIQGNDISLMKKLKSEIIKNKALWQSGIPENRTVVNGGLPYLKLRTLRKGTGWQKFTNPQVLTVYNRLISELDKIKDIMGRHNFVDGLMNFKAILQEMIWFLEDESKYLSTKSDYVNTLNSANALFKKSMHDLDRLDALFSENSIDINWALIGLSRDLYDNNNFNKNDLAIRQVLIRIANINLVGLEACIIYVVNWFYEFKGADTMKTFTNLAINVLNQFLKRGYPSECEIPLVEEKLIELAFVLKSWGHNTTAIRFFIGKIQSNRYNNINYTLAHRLQKDGLLVI